MKATTTTAMNGAPILQMGNKEPVQIHGRELKTTRRADQELSQATHGSSVIHMQSHANRHKEHNKVAPYRLTDLLWHTLSWTRAHFARCLFVVFAVTD